MTPRSLFSVIVKCLGLFFIKDFIFLVPSFMSGLYFFFDSGNLKLELLTVLINIVILGIYLFVIYYLLFRTSWIIKKLKLDQGFDEENFSFRIHRSSILSVVIIITGLLVVIDAVPTLCRQLFLYFQEKATTHGQTRPDISRTLATLAQLIVGLLLIGNQRQIVNFIERKRRNASIKNEHQI